MTKGQALHGRRARAARNDQLILDSAQTVFDADPGAPVSAVARHAGVGMSALYARFASKEDLLRKLCTDALGRFITATEAALADDRDTWTVFTSYMNRLIEADVSSMTLALAGQFRPVRDVLILADRASQLLGRLFEKISGGLRPGTEAHDLCLILELVAAVKEPRPERTRKLRQRYLTLIMDGLRAQDGPLPGSAPTWPEVSQRWQLG